MAKEINIGTGVTAPFKVKEGTITITNVATAHGERAEPVLSAGVKKLVTLLTLQNGLLNQEPITPKHKQSVQTC